MEIRPAAAYLFGQTVGMLNVQWPETLRGPAGKNSVFGIPARSILGLF
jgi:hypothetical protein